MQRNYVAFKQVLPSMPEARNTAQRSSLQTDFTYFGPKTNGDNRHRHTDNFNAIKTLHGCDSVGASIQGMYKCRVI